MRRLYPSIGIRDLLFLAFLIFGGTLSAQSDNPVEGIRDLKEGYLLIRLPGYRAKIDTLHNILSTTKDQEERGRLQKLLDAAVEERDSIHTQYKRAFKSLYNFSKTAYFFDYEARKLPDAHFFTMDGEPVSWSMISNKPFFTMHFERTQESKVDALVIYNAEGQKMKRPFPNDFTRSGFNFLFLRLTEKPFADWRVSKINKRFHQFWNQVN